MSGESAPSRLHTIVVTYRRPRELAEMLRILSTLDDTVASAVVVDNAPCDQNAKRVSLLGSYTDVHYLPMSENLGPAGGIAVGMEHVLRYAADTDWLLLLDDDDPPADGLIRETWRFGERMAVRDPATAGVGLSGARLLRSGRVQRIPSDELSGPVAVDYVAGGSLPIYRIGAIRAVGVFDSELFFGFEELEYGLRFKSHGFRLYVDGPLLLRRRAMRGTVSQKRRPRVLLHGPVWRRYYSLRNMIVILRRQGMVLQAIKATTFALAKAGLNFVVGPRNALPAVVLTLKAAVHGWRGQMGRTVDPDTSPDTSNGSSRLF